MRNRRLILEARSRGMKLAPTASEAALWRAIRGNRLGVAFRRQVVIGGFIVDFAAPSARIAVEVDGGWHTNPRAADARRDRKLARLGYRVVRLEAEFVLERPEAAVARIVASLAERR